MVWQSTILAGHGVVEAARQLGWRGIRADVLPDDYPEHLALAYLVADNELARHSDPDEAQLAALLDEARAICYAWERRCHVLTDKLERCEGLLRIEERPPQEWREARAAYFADKEPRT